MSAISIPYWNPAVLFYYRNTFYRYDFTLGVRRWVRIIPGIHIIHTWHMRLVFLFFFFSSSLNIFLSRNLTSSFFGKCAYCVEPVVLRLSFNSASAFLASSSEVLLASCAASGILTATCTFNREREIKERINFFFPKTTQVYKLPSV